MEFHHDAGVIKEHLQRENLLITLSPSLTSLGNCYNIVEGFAELL